MPNVERIRIVGNPALYARAAPVRNKWTVSQLMNGESKSEARQIIDAIEDKRKLPRGSILSDLQRHLIVEARYDAMAEVYLHFLAKGQRLSLQQLGEIFNRTIAPVRYALLKRGVVEA